MIVCDTSAVVAILLQEPDHERFREALAQSDRIAMSLVTKVELQIVAHGRLGPDAAGDLERVFALTGMDFVPFDERQALLAKDAYRRYGRGSGSPARLNFGDCFSYALARALDRPLLFKGDDFPHTDVTSALGSS